MNKLWGGRFKKEMHPLLKCFSTSLQTDFELLGAELRVNEAWVKMLARVRLVTKSEASRLLAGLKAVGKELTPKDPHGGPDKKYFGHEDIHTLIQASLERKVGAVARKIHTGRSRNDLVVTSTRVYLRQKNSFILQLLAGLQKSLVGLAKKAGGLTGPGMTHLRKAQPVLVAHHLLAYVEMLEEDKERFLDAGKRMDRLDLGSAALAGSALGLDQKFLARELGFSKIAANSLAAVSDRGFVAEFLAAASILWTHLSRLAEDFILWNSESFGFIEIDDAFATGSSLMPQKKNPDVFELVRGRSAAIFSALQTLLTLQKGLPLAYNRDSQEDKPPLFDSIKKTQIALELLALTLDSVSFQKEALEAAVQEETLFATDILEYLVRKGVPFSEAHEAVGRVIRYAQDSQESLRDLALKEWKKFSKAFDSEVQKLFDPESSVSGKRTIGSTNPKRVTSEIQKWRRRLKM